MKVRLTAAADAHIQRLLQETLRLFGIGQTDNYASILQGGLDLIAKDPLRPASLRREELGPGVRSLHLEHVRGRRKSAAHVIFYQILKVASGDLEAFVVGVLQERMEPRRRLAKGLREIEGNGP